MSENVNAKRRRKKKRRQKQKERDEKRASEQLKALQQAFVKTWEPGHK